MPSSMSACFIHRRTDSGAISKSAATSATFRSPRRATATTSRLNSGGNFLGMATSFLRGKPHIWDVNQPCSRPPIQKAWIAVKSTVIPNVGGKRSGRI